MVLRGSAGSAVAIGRGEGAAGEPAGRVLCIKSGRGGRVVCRKAAAPQAPGTLSALRSVIAVSTHLRALAAPVRAGERDADVVLRRSARRGGWTWGTTSPSVAERSRETPAPGA